MKSVKGITLISLVITIIVLIILSSVGIYLAIGNNGIMTKAQQAKEETIKQTAIEKMRLKIINIQLETYPKQQRMPTLQEFVDELYKDNEIQYISLESKKLETLEKVEVGDASSIFTKLKEYPYEFEIDSLLQIISIDGIKHKEPSAESETIVIGDVIFEIIEVTTTTIQIKINVDIENIDNIKGYFAYVNEEVVMVQDSNIITITELEDGTNYNIKCGVMDKQGKIKESSIKQITTKELLYDGTNYYNRITTFTPFRVDNASGYTAYVEGNGFYQLVGLNASGRAGINTNEKVDLTDVSSIEVNTNMYNNYGSSFVGTIYLGIYTEKDNTLNFTKSVQYSTNAVSASPESKKLELDVSDISGEYYIKVIALHPSNITNYGFYTNIFSLILKLNNDEKEIENSRESQESNLVSEVTFEVIQVRDTSIQIQINATTGDENNLKGYYICANGEIGTVNNQSLITIEGLEDGKAYNIKCGIIDKQGNIRESEEKRVVTLTNETLYDGTNYLSRITAFTPFRVDSSDGYTAYVQGDGFYQLVGLGASGRAGINTNEKLDLTHINFIEIDTQLYNNYGSSFVGTIYLGIYTEKDNTLNFTKSVNYSTNAVNASPESKKLELDVSDITGEYYVKVIALHPSNVSEYGFYTNIYSLNLKLENDI